MASQTTSSRDGHAGGLKFAHGTFTATAGTQEIETGLALTLGIKFQHTNDNTVTAEPAVDETFPFAGKSVTLSNTSAKSGVWLAWGY